MPDVSIGPRRRLRRKESIMSEESCVTAIREITKKFYGEIDDIEGKTKLGKAGKAFFD
jgi:hypothetical protein